MLEKYISDCSIKYYIELSFQLLLKGANTKK